jgi:hypothetical protein
MNATIQSFTEEILSLPTFSDDKLPKPGHEVNLLSRAREKIDSNYVKGIEIVPLNANESSDKYARDEIGKSKHKKSRKIKRSNVTISAIEEHNDGTEVDNLQKDISISTARKTPKNVLKQNQLKVALYGVRDNIENTTLSEEDQTLLAVSSASDPIPNDPEIQIVKVKKV